MGHYVFRLPDVGEGVADAEIVAWHARIGDQLAEDQPLVDVMTDKATVEMTTPVAGRILALHGEIGQRMPVGSALAELATEEDATPPAFPRREPASAGLLAAPATRRRAAELGIALHLVPGTGP